MSGYYDDDRGDEDGAMAAINTTPLVDVMLVLLIIFLIAVPVVIKTVPVQLPKEASIPTQTAPGNITIAIDRDGRMFWNEAALPDVEALTQRLAEAAARQPQPEIHIRGDRNGRYGPVGAVVAACQRAGINKLGFITDPTGSAKPWP
jgi:biopolymer transport protein ExbD